MISQTEVCWEFSFFGFRYSGNQIVTVSIGNKGVTTQKTVSPGVETLFWQDCDTKNEWRTFFPPQSCHNVVSTPGTRVENRFSCIYFYACANGYIRRIFPLNYLSKEYWPPYYPSITSLLRCHHHTRYIVNGDYYISWLYPWFFNENVDLHHGI